MRWLMAIAVVAAAAVIMLAAGNSNGQSLGSSVQRLPIQNQDPRLNITWNFAEITDGSLPAEIIADTREAARNGLPDGRVAVPDIEQDIAKAWYSEPTNRYQHGVLGDAIEAGALKIEDTRGRSFVFRLPRTEVFEDITPRLADLDRDGTTEVICILSSRDEGASVAVFGLVGNAFIKKAQSSYIGRPNRWLNIAGIGRFSGRRNLEIAVVETPHLAGALKLYRFDASGALLKSRSSTRGFSNHQIGSRELRLSALALIDSDSLPDLLVPSLDRRTLFSISLAGGEVKLLSQIALPAAIDKAIGTRESNGKLEILVGLSDSKTYAISRQ